MSLNAGVLLNHLEAIEECMRLFSSLNSMSDFSGYCLYKKSKDIEIDIPAYMLTVIESETINRGTFHLKRLHELGVYYDEPEELEFVGMDDYDDFVHEKFLELSDNLFD